jgi:hypothetical protein
MTVLLISKSKLRKKSTLERNLKSKINKNQSLLKFSAISPRFSTRLPKSKTDLISVMALKAK